MFTVDPDLVFLSSMTLLGHVFNRWLDMEAGLKYWNRDVVLIMLFSILCTTGWLLAQPNLTPLITFSMMVFRQVTDALSLPIPVNASFTVGELSIKPTTFSLAGWKLVPGLPETYIAAPLVSNILKGKLKPYGLPVAGSLWFTLKLLTIVSNLHCLTFNVPSNILAWIPVFKFLKCVTCGPTPMKPVPEQL